MSNRYNYVRKAAAAPRTRYAARRPSRSNYVRTTPSNRRYIQRARYAKTRAENKAPSGIVKSLGTLGGTALGGYFGGPPGAALGSAIGSKAADLFTSITGMGDYNVSYNTLTNPNQTPVFKQHGRSVFVSHREYIEDVITGPANQFKISAYDLNPADPQTYPWLATISQNFEEYRIHGMVFHYKSNSADALNSVNTALGTVVMATQYNVLLDVFQNKQQMENYEFGCSGRPSKDILHPVECDPKVTSFGPIFDIRLGGNDKGDPRLYTPGRFSIATVGQQGDNVNIGELWVTYEIEFFKPRMGDVASQINQWRIQGTFGAETPFSVPASVNISESSDFAACTLDPVNRLLIFDNGYTGKVQITIIWRSDTPIVESQNPPTFVVSGGASQLRTLYPGNLGSATTVAAGSLSNMSIILFLTIVNGGLVTFNNNGLLNGYEGCDVIVTTLPSTFQVYEPEDDL